MAEVGGEEVCEEREGMMANGAEGGGKKKGEAEGKRARVRTEEEKVSFIWGLRPRSS